METSVASACAKRVAAKKPKPEKKPLRPITRMILRPDAERVMSLDALAAAISAFQHFVKWHSGRLLSSVDPFDVNDENVAFYARFCRIGTTVDRDTIKRANIAIHGTIAGIARKYARKKKREEGRAKLASSAGAASASAVAPLLAPTLPRLKSVHARYQSIGTKKAFGAKCALAHMHSLLKCVRDAVSNFEDKDIVETDNLLFLVQKVVS